MSYSGVAQTVSARELLSRALASLQEDPNIPPDVLAVAQNMAQAMGSLFQAEKASVELDGKNAVRSALGFLSQTLALLQDVRSQHPGIAQTTEAIAKVMSILFPLTTIPSRPPPAAHHPIDVPSIPRAAGLPRTTGAHEAPRAPAASGPRLDLEANIGATTESNFFVGFSGEITEGGVFIATYNVVPVGTLCTVLVTLPGGFETKTQGRVRFVRDPMDFAADAEPGVGVAFEGLTGEQRELVMRFVRKRPPLFYDE